MKMLYSSCLGLLIGIGIAGNVDAITWPDFKTIKIKNNLRWGAAKRDESGIKVFNVCSFNISEDQCKVSGLTIDGKPVNPVKVTLQVCSMWSDGRCLGDIEILPGETKEALVDPTLVVLDASYGGIIVRYQAQPKDYLEFPSDFNLK